MATEEVIEIRYLVRATDQASKTLSSIDKQMGALRESVEETNKVTKQVEKNNKSIGSTVSDMVKNFDAATNSVINLGRVILNLDFNKIIRGLTILGTLLRLRGFKTLSNLMLRGAKSIDVVKTQVDFLNNSIGTLQERYGSLTNAFLETTGINSALRGLGELAKGATLAGVAFAGIVGFDKSFEILEKGFIKLNTPMNFVAEKLVNLQKTFPRMASAGLTGLDALRKGADSLFSTFVRGRNVTLGLKGAFTANRVAAQSVGKSFLQASMHTELFEKGVFGLMTRMATLSAGFFALGSVMLTTDSTMLKISGTTLIALSIALGGIGVVIKSLIVSFGNLLNTIGTKMVDSMQGAIDNMVVMADKTFTLKFVLDSVNEAARGATGSFDEWNVTIDSFVEKTGFAKDGVQSAVSELVRFGEGIGLNKKQMQQLLPVIGDVAEANHKGIFQSTLAVVEALAGQTMMLQNLGINLTQHAVLESKRAKAIGHSMKALSEHEKTQLRFNVLMDKVAPIVGIAEASINTSTGALRRQDAMWKKLSVSLGAGASIIEQNVNTAFADMLEVLGKFSEGPLKVIGFMTSLIGRALQASGFFLKWAFAVVFLMSTISALNILLGNQIIAKYLIQLSQSVFITKTLAAANVDLALTMQGLLFSMGTTGLGIKTLGALFKTTLISMTKALWAFLAPFIVIAIKIAIVVAVIWLLYKALALIDERTKIFTNTWKKMVEWWNKSSVLEETIIPAFKKLGELMIGAVGKSIIFVAQTIVRLVIVFKKVQASVELLKVAFKDLIGTMLTSLSKAPALVLKMLGISAKGKDMLALAGAALQGSNEKNIKTIDTLSKEVLALNRLIKDLGVEHKKTARNIASANEEEADSHKKLFDFVSALRQARVLSDAEIAEIERVRRQLISDENFNFLVESLGRDEALRAIFKAKELSDEGKHQEAIASLKGKFLEADVKNRNKIAQIQKSIDKDLLAKEKQIQDSKIGLAKASADAILALSGDSKIAALALSKGMAVADIFIQDARARAGAMASTASLPVGVREAELTRVNTAISANTGLALGIVAAQTLASAARFENGGIVKGSQNGDNVIVRANGGEMFLNQSQQSRLFNQINGGSQGGGNVSESLDNLAGSISSQPVVVKIGSREIARAVRDERKSGFQI